MHYHVDFQPESQKISLTGPLTYTDHVRFKELMALVFIPGSSRLDLDFSEVSYIDSAGLGMLLLLRDNCIRQQRQLRITGAQGQVQRSLSLSRFDQLFDIG